MVIPVTAPLERMQSRRRLSLGEMTQEVAAAVSLSIRSLRRTPVVSAAVIGTLALGICLVTVFFSFINTVILRPLPFADASRLVLVFKGGASNDALSAVGSAKVFEGIGAYTGEYGT